VIAPWTKELVELVAQHQLELQLFVLQGHSLGGSQGEETPPFASALEGDELAELAVLGVDSSDPRANLQSIRFCWQGTTAQAGQHLQLLDSLHG